MKFVFPEFLWALSLIAIPIIIHLFNFRKYTTVYFSDVRFLKEVKEETRRRSTLKHILILISRILAITALVLAFAQPFIPGPTKSITQGDTVVSIYLDNSFSMDSEGEEGSLLNMGRQMAVEIAEKFDETTQFQLVTNEFEGYQQRLISRQAFLTQLDETVISPTFRSVPEVFKRQAEVLNRSEAANKLAFMISDFQTTMFEGDIPADSLNSLTTILVSANNRDNVYIDSLWFESPVRQINKVEILKVRIRNRSKEAFKNLSVNISLSGNKRSTTLTVQPQSEAVADLSFSNAEAGIQHGKVYLNVAESQIRFDDTLYMSYDVLKAIRVLEIGAEDKRTFENIFAEDESFLFERTNVRALDLSNIDRQNLIILHGLNEISSGLAAKLQAFVRAGGNVCVFPGERIDLNSYGSLLLELDINTYAYRDTQNLRVQSIQNEHLFFKDVFESYNPNMDLPRTFAHYHISGSYASGEEKLFTFFGGSPFLSAYPAGLGRVYLCAVPLADSYSNFRRHALFVTSVIRMAELSFPARPLFYTIGGLDHPEVRDEDYNPELNFEMVSGNTRIIPIQDRTKPGAISLITSYGQQDEDMLKSAGNYTLLYDGRPVTGISYNYDRQESQMTFPAGVQTLDSLMLNYRIRDLITSSAQTIGDVKEMIAESKAKTYWKICLILALIFLAIEIALIKLWRT